MILSAQLIDPVMLTIGPLSVHWYGAAYMVGILAGWRYALVLSDRFQNGITRQHIDDAITWILLGIVIGGRLGHVLLYDPIFYLHHPLDILKVWAGGMSFHGGLLGVLVALGVYCYRHKLSYRALTDILAPVTPIGLFCGRLANFVNGELFGRPTDGTWGFLFTYGGGVPRHPSQLYEAGLEGALLFLMLWYAWRVKHLYQHRGFLCGLGLIGYSVARCTGEVFREPEIFGLIGGIVTWGQILCLPLLLAGAWLCGTAPFTRSTKTKAHPHR